MAGLPEAVVNSVASLGLNGSTEHTNGVLEDVVVKNICCVGAGYVGKLAPFWGAGALLQRCHCGSPKPPAGPLHVFLAFWASLLSLWCRSRLFSPKTLPQGAKRESKKLEKGKTHPMKPIANLYFQVARPLLSSHSRTLTSR
jgi:hypothetical protein